MVRKFLVVLVVLCISFSACLAKDDKEKQKTQAAAQAPSVISTQEQKDLLVANVTTMRNHELRVAVLQQLLNEEVGKLRNLQATFCDKYNLDVEKFRKGLYRYDEKTGKFTETDSTNPPVNP